MDGRDQVLETLLTTATSWAQARILATLAATAGGATPASVARLLCLPEREVELALQTLARQGAVVRDEESCGGDPLYRLSDTASLSAMGAPAEPVVPPAEPASPQPGLVSLDPAPGAEGRDSRQVAADVTALYRRLFEREPRLSWLLRQRRRAMVLGQDFGQLLAGVRAAQPRGDPQAYLEGVLKRLERERETA